MFNHSTWQIICDSVELALPLCSEVEVWANFMTFMLKKSYQEISFVWKVCDYKKYVALISK